ncbi:MAG: hypothetical protein Q7T82_10285 [Armatimonadota bacterium]|nr:hypothetical protein [Armatimonadota bacterium]
MEHPTWQITILTFALSLSVLIGIFYNRWLSGRGRSLFIRRIPGLSALDEAVGRATEMGRPVLFVPGIGSLDIVSLQALAILSHVTRIAARYGSRVIVPSADSIVFTLAEEVSREAYTAEDAADHYDPEDVRYLSDNQFAFASGVVGILNREKVASACYFGSFFAESLILAETGHQVGAIQVAGTPSTTQIPFFLAACDYTIIGDEFFAASAYLSREPTLLGSLVGQDVAKGIIIALVIAGTAIATVFGVQSGVLKGLLGL